jgi:hypothetical protein
MGYYNRKNALVGYLMLAKARRHLKGRRRRQRLRSGFKIAAFVALGIVSVGILAGLAAALMKRRHQETEEVEEIADEVEDFAAEAEAAMSEPIPAT